MLLLHILQKTRIFEIAIKERSKPVNKIFEVSDLFLRENKYYVWFIQK